MNRGNEILLTVAQAMQERQERQPAAADDVGVTLAALTQDALDCVPAAQHAGITVASQDGAVHTAAATDRYPSVLDGIQQRHGGGPCLSAAIEDRVICVNDLTLERRWPGYCRDVLDQTPIRSIMAFQLFTTAHSVSALNFFAEQPGAFDDEALETGLIVATHTAMGWHTLRRDEQFRSALVSRDIIGQAKGMIMERYGVDAVQAFDMLKRLSQGSNTKLIEIAHQLIERGHHDDERH